MKTEILSTLDQATKALLADPASAPEVADTLQLVRASVENLKTHDGDGTEAARIERNSRRVRRQTLLECAAHVAEADSLEDARAALERLLLSPRKEVGFTPFAEVLAPYKAEIEYLRERRAALVSDLEKAEIDLEQQIADLRNALHDSEASAVAYAEEAGQAKDLMAQQAQVHEGIIASLVENHEQYQKALADTLVELGLLDGARVAEHGLTAVLMELEARKALPPNPEPAAPETPTEPGE
jgi:DNA repair exonuclease SbcCD ATPase subunit